jgi:hypothetical protein
MAKGPLRYLIGPLEVPYYCCAKIDACWTKLLIEVIKIIDRIKYHKDVLYW